MDNPTHELAEVIEGSATADSEALTLDVKSVALQRLIDEVENHGDITLEGYNRSYHRHNR